MFGVGLLGFVFTWIVAFILRVFMVPARLFEEERLRGNMLEEQLNNVDTQRNLTSAIRARLQQLSAADPHVQVMNESRKRGYESGVSLSEWSLGLVVHWIATTSAWARWQTAQSDLYNDKKWLLRITQSYVGSMLATGELTARGRRGKEPPEFISPDWWGQASLQVTEDMGPTIWTVTIQPRHGVEDSVAHEFADISCDRNQIEADFPKEDAYIDGLTAAILAKKDCAAAVT